MLAPPRSNGTAQYKAFLGWVTSSRVCRPKPSPCARCVIAQLAQVFRELLRENGRAHFVLDHPCDATPTRWGARAGRCTIPRSSRLSSRGRESAHVGLRSVAHRRVGHELADLLSTAA